MVIHDLICAKNHIETNVPIQCQIVPKCKCGLTREILWQTDRTRAATIHTRERSVVWLNRKTGSIAYPPANNLPMPDRYSNGGYERVEFESLHSLDKFCKSRNLINDKAHFDGSGHSDEL